MKKNWLILIFVAVSFAASGCERLNLAKGNEAVKTEINFVCPEPNEPCQHAQNQFADGELSFHLPEKIALYKTYESEAFYAVILKTFSAPCSEFGANPQIESERIAIQRNFPARKVFAENGCGRLSAVEYDFAGKNNLKRGAASDLSFIAVFAGREQADAQNFFENIRADYPQAELVKMTARFRKIER